MWGGEGKPLNPIRTERRALHRMGSLGVGMQHLTSLLGVPPSLARQLYSQLMGFCIHALFSFDMEKQRDALQARAALLRVGEPTSVNGSKQTAQLSWHLHVDTGAMGHIITS